MTALIVKEDGLIYAAEVPEEPKKWDYEAGGNEQGAYVSPEYYDALEAYETALASAKESAVLVSDQEKARELIIRKGSISRDKDGFYQPIVGVHPIPDLQWKTKMHNPCIAKRDCQEPGENGWKCLHTCKRQHLVAILKESTPSTEQESQEAIFEVIRYCRRTNLECSAGGYKTMFEYLKRNFTITRKP